MLVQTAIVLVTAACFAIPGLEIMGHYHHSFLSGHDMVASLAAVALSLAGAVPVVRAVFAFRSEPLTLRRCAVPTALCFLPASADIEAPLGGPLPPLRI